MTLEGHTDSPITRSTHAASPVFMVWASLVWRVAWPAFGLGNCKVLAG